MFTMERVSRKSMATTHSNLESDNWTTFTNCTQKPTVYDSNRKVKAVVFISPNVPKHSPNLLEIVKTVKFIPSRPWNVDKWLIFIYNFYSLILILLLESCHLKTTKNLGIQLKTATVISKNLLNCFALTENNQSFGVRTF